MSVFIDTTILVCAHDERAEKWHCGANRLVRELWRLPVQPIISVGVCLELWRALESSGLPEQEAVELVGAYLHWRVVPEDGEGLAAAMELRRESEISLPDACVVAAALRAGARQLWSIGLESGRRFGALEVVNPLTREAT